MLKEERDKKEFLANGEGDMNSFNGVKENEEKNSYYYYLQVIGMRWENLCIHVKINKNWLFFAKKCQLFAVYIYKKRLNINIG